MQVINKHLLEVGIRWFIIFQYFPFCIYYEPFIFGFYNDICP